MLQLQIKIILHFKSQLYCNHYKFSINWYGWLKSCFVVHILFFLDIILYVLLMNYKDGIKIEFYLTTKLILASLKGFTQILILIHLNIGKQVENLRKGWIVFAEFVILGDTVESGCENVTDTSKGVADNWARMLNTDDNIKCSFSIVDVILIFLLNHVLSHAHIMNKLRNMNTKLTYTWSWYGTQVLTLHVDSCIHACAKVVAKRKNTSIKRHYLSQIMHSNEIYDTFICYVIARCDLW